LKFWSLPGYIPYEKARELQLRLVDLRVQDRIPDTVLFLEHEPVITRGRGLQFTGTPRPKHMPLMQVLPEGVAFAESERGGDLTYHGPGQLVIYPICKLDGSGFAPKHDIAGYLRRMEEFLIQDLAVRGVSAESRENATGVWIGDKKIASMGVAIRKWTTYHGIAINCVNDLRPFHLISPCGYSPEVMTRLSDWVMLGSDWRREMELSFAERMLKSATQKVSQSDSGPELTSVDLNHIQQLESF
jgi:lipoate-protein ligase B